MKSKNDRITKLEAMIGELLYRVGEPVGISTAVDGSITAGYGEIDQCGYWEFPCYSVSDRVNKEYNEN